MKRLLISIVSHGQGELIKEVLNDLNKLCFEGFHVTVVLVLNIPECNDFFKGLTDLDIHVINNLNPRGFGENHNNSFSQFESDYFLILNPDLRFRSLNLSAISSMINDKCPIVSTIVKNSQGDIEDNFRKFPTLFRLIKRILSSKRELDYTPSDFTNIDWAGGMFLFFDSNWYKNNKGFDEGYFMYLEDVDICKRLKLQGGYISVDQTQFVIHDARRKSLKDLRHLRWHVMSLLRFLFIKPILVKLKIY